MQRLSFQAIESYALSNDLQAPVNMSDMFDGVNIGLEQLSQTVGFRIVILLRAS
jgi:hypothetical protein